ncbi:16S rRNA pseudouridine(516) synthase [Enterococcus dispar]
MRLDKLIEETLHTSRKEMKRLFSKGQVTVDGIKENQQNRNVDSNIHHISAAGIELFTNEVYYLLDKPIGAVTANSDLKYQTVFDCLALKDNQPNLYAVGRLDRDTSGFLLLTSNGQLGYDLLHPVKKVAKVYEAWINEIVTAEDIAKFQEGIIFLDGTHCQPAILEILLLDEQVGHSLVRLTIWEGKFHQVKKMFLACGKKVIALRRIEMGPLRLPENSQPGNYQKLTQTQLALLKPYFR